MSNCVFEFPKLLFLMALRFKKKCQPVDPELLCTRTLANPLTLTCE